MNGRSRLAVGALMALLVTITGGSLAVQAADTPEGAVTAVIDAFEAKDFAGIAPLICEARRDEIAGDFDVAASFSGSGFDPQIILDGLTLSIDDPQVTVVSQDETTAVVHLAATMSMTMALDEEVISGLVVDMLQAQGMEVTDVILDQFLPTMVESLNQSVSEDVDADVTVANEDGQWLLCDTFEADAVDAEATPIPSASPSA
jgi:hypothetical protein